MKVLHRLNKWEIAIENDNNYVVYDWERKSKYSYHSRMDGAVRELSRLNANEVSNDLDEWVKVYSAACEMALGA